MNCKVESAVAGKAKIFATNTLTRERKEIKCKNMILDRYLDTLGGTRLFVALAAAIVFLGTSTTSEDGTSTGLKGTEIDKVTSTVSQINIDDIDGNYGYIVRHKAVFPANSKIGTVKELVLNGISRVVLETPIDKDEYTQIEVTWDIRQMIKVYSGVISKGQSDGETDIEWQLTIPYHSRNGLGPSNHSLAVSPEIYFTGNKSDSKAYLRVGTSNEPTNLNSTNYNVYGTQLVSRLASIERSSYVTGSYERSFSILLDANEAINNIGEVLFYTKMGNLTTYFRLFFRITFTPPLDKSGPDPYRLRLRFTFSVSRDTVD